MTIFLIKSTISMAVLLLVYKLFLEKEKMHRFNRFYLLFSLVISFSLPFFTYTTKAQTNIIKGFNQLPNVILQDVTIKNTAQGLILEEWLLIIYSFICAVLIIRFANNIHAFSKQIKDNKIVKYKSAKLVMLPNNILPHTFLDYIFINEDDYKKNAIEKDLYTHELAHVNQKHTLDILFIEILKTIFWFNPLLYLYKKAIQLNHEFLADEAVLNTNHNTAGYQNLLLQLTSGSTVALASNINFSITKKRFIMMTKTTPKLLALSKQLLLLPVLAGLFFVACAENDTTNPETQSVEATDETVPTLPSPDEKEVSSFANLTTQPQYPGGMQEFYQQIMKNFNVPEVEQDMDARVFVSFIVETDGTMSNIKVVKDPGYGLGEEALRVLSNMTEKWAPGEKDGEKVRTSFALPITINVKA